MTSYKLIPHVLKALVDLHDAPDGPTVGNIVDKVKTNFGINNAPSKLIDVGKRVRESLKKGVEMGLFAQKRRGVYEIQLPSTPTSDTPNEIIAKTVRDLCYSGRRRRRSSRRRSCRSRSRRSRRRCRSRRGHRRGRRGSRSRRGRRRRRSSSRRRRGRRSSRRRRRRCASWDNEALLDKNNAIQDVRSSAVLEDMNTLDDDDGNRP